VWMHMHLLLLHKRNSCVDVLCRESVERYENLNRTERVPDDE